MTKKRPAKGKTSTAQKPIQWSELKGVGKHTLEELTQLKEILALASGMLIPGGMAAYSAYRVQKYRRQKLDDNVDAA